jgi:hypothetical protein
MKRKKRFSPKITKEQYKEMTGQSLGALKGQGISEIVKIIDVRSIINDREAN